MGGNETITEWDGTREDAINTIDDVAMSDSYNASGDYWLTRGWRTRTLSSGDEE